MRAILNFYLPYVPHYQKSRRGRFLAILMCMLILGIVSFSPLLIKQQWRGGGVGMLLMVGVLQTVWCGVIRAQTQTHGNGERILINPLPAYWGASAVVIVIALITFAISGMATGVLRLQT
jgi:hypothetical protein